MFALEDDETADGPARAAIGLYERMGFEREGLRRDHYRRDDGKLHSSVIMARLFPDATPPPPGVRS